MKVLWNTVSGVTGSTVAYVTTTSSCIDVFLTGQVSMSLSNNCRSERCQAIPDNNNEQHLCSRTSHTGHRTAAVVTQPTTTPTGFSHRQSDTLSKQSLKNSWPVMLETILQSVSVACYAKPCISYGRVVCLSVRLSVRPSVRVSVTRWHRVKTTQAMFSRTDSPRTLVFGMKSSTRNTKVFTPSEGVKWEWGRKNSQFTTSLH